MTARCGDRDPNHRSRGCLACNRLYKLRHRRGEPKMRLRIRADTPPCAVCGIATGNSLGVGVYRYPLKRYAARKARWIGTVALCDNCLEQRAVLKPEYRRTAA